jgi:Tfp pilus assembly protein PilW
VVELLVSLTVMTLVAGGLLTFLFHNARLSKTQRLTAEAQANARSCLTTVVQKLRSAGWDPMNAGIATVVLDPDTTDNISQIEIFADLDMDGTTNGTLEQALIRHVNDRVEWRPTNSTGQPFEIVALHISNDADGDGTPEPMFVPDSTSDPKRITVTVTATSPSRDPVSNDFVRYTVSSEVVLRKAL